MEKGKFEREEGKDRRLTDAEGKENEVEVGGYSAKIRKTRKEGIDKIPKN